MIRRLLNVFVGGAVAVAAIRTVVQMLRSPRALASSVAAQELGVARGSLLKPLMIAGALLLAAGAIGGGLAMLSGVVSTKASSGHWAITEAVLQFAKRRSVATYSAGIKVPPLEDRRLVVMGAGHYDFACRPCHGSPALEQPRIARQMLPRPPDLRESVRRYDAEDLFYIVKHGIKLTGMPAWPALQRDDEVWAVVAFLQTLPGLDGRAYEELANGPARDERPPIEALVTPEEIPEAISDSCRRCHGIDGLGRGVGAFPRLAGQRPEYLFASLQAYAKGERHSGMMEPVAAALGTDEMRRIAEYYASRGERGPGRQASDAGGDLALGRTIALEGLPDRLVPACVTCHGPDAQPRNPVYPRLAGQSPEYLAQQLRLLRAGARGGTAYHNIMRRVAGQLTDEQIRAAAAYFASLPWASE